MKKNLRHPHEEPQLLHRFLSRHLNTPEVVNMWKVQHRKKEEVTSFQRIDISTENGKMPASFLQSRKKRHLGSLSKSIWKCCSQNTSLQPSKACITREAATWLWRKFFRTISIHNSRLGKSIATWANCIFQKSEKAMHLQAVRSPRSWQCPRHVVYLGPKKEVANSQYPSKETAGSAPK